MFLTVNSHTIGPDTPSYIAEQHNITKIEASKIIDIFTDSVTSALGKNNEVLLVGFGKFYSLPVAARKGRNPKTGESLDIKAYTQPKFTVGQGLKDACNVK